MVRGFHVFVVVSFFICGSRSLKECAPDQVYCESFDQCFPVSCENCSSFKTCNSLSFLRECTSEFDNCKESGVKCVDFCDANTSRQCPEETQLCKILTPNQSDVICKSKRQVFCSNLEQCFGICSKNDWPTCQSCAGTLDEKCQQDSKNCSEVGVYDLVSKEATSDSTEDGLQTIEEECSENDESCAKSKQTTDELSKINTENFLNISCPSPDYIAYYRKLFILSSCKSSSDCKNDKSICCRWNIDGLKRAHCFDGQRFILPHCSLKTKDNQTSLLRMCPFENWKCMEEDEMCGKKCSVEAKYCAIRDLCILHGLDCKGSTSGGQAWVTPLTDKGLIPDQGFKLYSVFPSLNIQESAGKRQMKKLMTVYSNAGVPGRWILFSDGRRKKRKQRIKNGTTLIPESQIKFIPNKYNSQYGTAVLFLKMEQIIYTLVQYVMPGASMRRFFTTITESRPFKMTAKDLLQELSQTENYKYSEYIGNDVTKELYISNVKINEEFSVQYPIHLTYANENGATPKIRIVSKQEILQQTSQKRFLLKADNIISWEIHENDVIEVDFRNDVKSMTFKLIADEAFKKSSRQRIHDITFKFKRCRFDVSEKTEKIVRDSSELSDKEFQVSNLVKDIPGVKLDNSSSIIIFHVLNNATGKWTYKLKNDQKGWTDLSGIEEQSTYFESGRRTRIKSIALPLESKLKFHYNDVKLSTRKEKIVTSLIYGIAQEVEELKLLEIQLGAEDSECNVKYNKDLIALILEHDNCLKNCDIVDNTAKVIDCNGDVNGGAHIECGACIGGNTGIETLYDCAQVCNGSSTFILSGTTQICMKPQDTSPCPEEGQFINNCGNCVTESIANKGQDKCGVCNGHNKCLGCDGVPYSGKMVDGCGVCRDVSDEAFNQCVKIIGIDPEVFDLAINEDRWKFEIFSIGMENILDWNCELIKFGETTGLHFDLLKSHEGFLAGSLKNQDIKEGKYNVKCQNPSIEHGEIAYEMLEFINSRNMKYTSIEIRSKAILKKKVRFTVPSIVNVKNIQATCGIYRSHSKKVKFTRTMLKQEEGLIDCVCKGKIPGRYTIFVIFAQRRALRANMNWKEKFLTKNWLDFLIQHKLTIAGASPQVIEARISNDLKSVKFAFDSRVSGSSESCQRSILIDGNTLKDGCDIEFSGTKMIVKASGESSSLFKAGAVCSLLPALKIVPENSDPSFINSSNIQTVALKAPLDAIAPSFLLSGHNVICEGGISLKVVSVSGNGGSSLNYQWSITGFDAKQLEESYLSSDGSELNIPYEELTPSVYDVSVIGCNAVEKCSEPLPFTVDVTKSTSFVVSVSGPTIIYPNRQYTFVAEFHLCGGSAPQELVFEWSVKPNVDEELLKTFSGNILLLPKFWFYGGTDYTVSVQAVDKSTNKSSGSTLLVNAKLLPLVARTTNDYLNVYSEDVVLLDGSVSFDPGHENRTSTFKWECQKAKNKGGCYVVVSGERFENALANRLNYSKCTFDPKLLPPDIYEFNLLFSKGYRNASTSVTVNIIPEEDKSPEISIRMPRMIYSDGKTPSVISGFVTSNKDLACEFQNLNDDDYKMADVPDDTIYVKCPCDSYPVSTKVLLEIGSSYKFQMKCSYFGETSEMSNKASFVLNVHKMPLAMAININPKKGEAMKTEYNISIEEWVDESYNSPLTYKIGYLSKEKDKVVIGEIKGLQPLVLNNILLPYVESGLKIFVQGCNTAGVCEYAEEKVETVSSASKQEINETDLLRQEEQYRFYLEEQVNHLTSLVNRYEITYSGLSLKNLSSLAEKKLMTLFENLSKRINTSLAAQVKVTELIQKVNILLPESYKVLPELVETLLHANWNAEIEYEDPETSFHKLKFQVHVLLNGFVNIIKEEYMTRFSSCLDILKVVLMKICERVERQRDVHISNPLIKLSSKHVTFTRKQKNKIDSPEDGLGSIDIEDKHATKFKNPNISKQPMRSQLSTFRIDFDIASLLEPNSNIISDVTHASIARREEDVDVTDGEQKYLFIYDLKFRGNTVVKNPQCKFWNSSVFGQKPYWDTVTCVTVDLLKYAKCICHAPGTVALFNDGKHSDNKGQGNVDEEKILEITFDADYNKTVLGREEEFAKYTAFQLSIQLGIQSSQIIIISITEGSVNIIFKIQSSSENPISVEEATEILKEKIQNGELNLKDLDNNELQVLGLTSDNTVIKRPSEQTRDLVPVILTIVFVIAACIILSILVIIYVMKKKQKNEQKVGPESDEDQVPTYQSFEFEPVLGKYTTPVKKTSNAIFMSEYKPPESPPGAFTYHKPEKNEVTDYISDVVNSTYTTKEEERQFEENYDELNSSYHHDLFPVILDEDEQRNRLPHHESYM